jgi:hypothetical protein
VRLSFRELFRCPLKPCRKLVKVVRSKRRVRCNAPLAGDLLWGKSEAINAAELFREHFNEQGEEFADAFRMEIININKRLIFSLSILTIIFSLITAILYFSQPFDEVVRSYAFIVLSGATLLTIFRFDFCYQLNHSETLKKYGYRW